MLPIEEVQVAEGVTVLPVSAEGLLPLRGDNRYDFAVNPQTTMTLVRFLRDAGHRWAWVRDHAREILVDGLGVCLRLEGYRHVWQVVVSGHSFDGAMRLDLVGVEGESYEIEGPILDVPHQKSSDTRGGRVSRFAEQDLGWGNLNFRKRPDVSNPFAVTGKEHRWRIWWKDIPATGWCTVVRLQRLDVSHERNRSSGGWSNGF
jgi:hypothetical protein